MTSCRSLRPALIHASRMAHGPRFLFLNHFFLCAPGLRLSTQRVQLADDVVRKSPDGTHRTRHGGTTAANNERPAADDLIRVAAVPIRDDLLLKWDGNVATRTIENEILAGGKLVGWCLSRLRASTEKYPAANCSDACACEPRDADDGRPACVWRGRVKASARIFMVVLHGAVLSPYCCGSRRGKESPRFYFISKQREAPPRVRAPTHAPHTHAKKDARTNARTDTDTGTGTDTDIHRETETETRKEGFRGDRRATTRGSGWRGS